MSEETETQQVQIDKELWERIPPSEVVNGYVAQRTEVVEQAVRLWLHAAHALGAGDLTRDPTGDIKQAVHLLALIRSTGGTVILRDDGDKLQHRCGICGRGFDERHLEIR